MDHDNESASPGWLRNRLGRRGMRNALTPRLTRQPLLLPNLPAAFDGFRILHLSDLHFGTLPGLETAIRSLIVDQPVDLAIITGDLSHRCIRSHHVRFQSTLAALDRLWKSIRSSEGLMMVLGNNDSADLVPHLEKRGVRLLIDETVSLRRERDAIYLTGLDDVHRFRTPMAETALMEKPFDDRMAEPFRIALVHSPEIADVAARAGFSLYLCGHSHGGQICLPGGRPIVTHLSKPFRHLAAGPWRFEGMLGYTSRGAGVSVPPWRFNCPGEVALLTLVKADPRKGAGRG